MPELLNKKRGAFSCAGLTWSVPILLCMAGSAALVRAQSIAPQPAPSPPTVPITGPAPSPPTLPVTGPAPATFPRIETEVITVNECSAVPDAITRPPGKFFLLLINKSHTPLALTVDSADALVSTVSTLTKALNLPALATQRQLAGAFEATTGQYNLRSTVNGRILCTITIK